MSNGLVAAIVVVATSTQAFGQCEGTRTEPGLDRFYSQTWGTQFNGQRFQPAANTSINAANASKLELKWVYGLSTNSPRSYPLVTEDTIFIGDEGRGLVALDKENGCVRWENTEIQDISTAIVSEVVDGRTLLFFSGRGSGAFAVDAINGELVWQRFIDDDNPVPMFSGSPIVYKDKVFVPISSLEVVLTLLPFYGCCTTSGGMAALDSSTGELLWYRPTIEEEAEVSGGHWFFVDEFGPSGAPVWGAPMLDTKRRLLFYGSGQNYSRPASLTSDAIFAVHIDSGDIAWVKQFTAGDAYNLACGAGLPNCPEPVGPDVDFGAPPMLVNLATGEDLVIAGQKSGDVYGINPDSGETVWATRFGRGGPLGGVHWGMAANPEMELVFVPISDIPAGSNERPPQPGLYALNFNDGRLVWSVEREAKCEARSCWPGISAAIAAGPDIVVTGSLDGMLEIYRASDGELLWSYDTATEFSAVNELATKGGAFDAHGPMLADDLLIVSSGYGSFGQEGGNALLVFSPRRESP
ncbi:MAG: PQQ-binding-like beta-propeller repeat protein [Gammaproteobacteria bacterium]|nr:PQQ-binding-like beta-propeller repeat protein [Gammaproteobacteria bacterium]